MATAAAPQVPRDATVRSELEGIAAALQEELRANDAVELTYRRHDYNATLQHAVNTLNIRCRSCGSSMTTTPAAWTSARSPSSSSRRSSPSWRPSRANSQGRLQDRRGDIHRHAAPAHPPECRGRPDCDHPRSQATGLHGVHRPGRRAVHNTISRLKRSQDACAAAASLAEVDALIQKFPELNEMVDETLLVIETSLKFRGLCALPTYHHLMLTHLESEAGFRRDMGRVGQEANAGEANAGGPMPAGPMPVGPMPAVACRRGQCRRGQAPARPGRGRGRGRGRGVRCAPPAAGVAGTAGRGQGAEAGEVGHAEGALAGQFSLRRFSGAGRGTGLPEGVRGEAHFHHRSAKGHGSGGAFFC